MMRTDIYPIQAEGSQPDARLCTYILDRSDEIGIRQRPLILMCPGGGYRMTSDRESEALAVRFLGMGYHVAVLRYSCAPSVYPTALLEAALAMKLIHKHAEEWHVNKEKIIVQGASAGGHLAASLGIFWHEEWLAQKTGTTSDVLRPAAMLLCYPVITTGQYAHRGSFENLLRGMDTAEMREKLSLEKHVSEDTPKAFIWHTCTDPTVPAENSLLLIEALRKYQIPVEFHMYPVGGHGLGTCDEQTAGPDGYGIQKECQSWIPLARIWLEHI